MLNTKTSLGLQAIAVCVALYGCGGGADDATAVDADGESTAAADMQALAAAKPGKAAMSSPAGSQLPWNIATPVVLTLTDAKGKSVAQADLRCKPQSASTVSVTARCTSIRLKRLGEQQLVVSGGGVSAVLTVTGVPQRQWMSSSGSSGAFGSGTTAAVVAPDGRAGMWGSNAYARLGQNRGDGQLEEAPRPVLLLGPSGKSPMRDLAQVTIGQTAALALTDAGGVYAWGLDEWRQLGRDDVKDEARLPVRVLGATGKTPLGPAVQLAIGWGVAVALLDNGQVIGWGTNTRPVADDKLVPYEGAPVRITRPDGKAALSNIVGVTAGWAQAAALGADGQVYTWGWDLDSGALGAGKAFTFAAENPVVVVKAGRKPLTDIVAISSGYGFMVALGADGTVWAWGSNSDGQLGQDSTTLEHRPYAVQVKGPSGKGKLDHIVGLATGSAHVLALTDRGQVYAWGSGLNGELGDATTGGDDSSARPRLVMSGVGTKPLSEVASVSAAGYNSFALKRDGTVLSWGARFKGALGHETTLLVDERTPTAVRSVSGKGSLELDPVAYPNLQQRGR